MRRKGISAKNQNAGYNAASSGSPLSPALPATSALACVRAVTFDVGGTLVEPWPSVGDVYAAVAAAHGCPGISPRSLNKRFVATWRALRGFEHTRAQWAALVDATFGGLTSKPPSQTFFPELYDEFARSEAWHVFDDVRPALDALAKRGLRLGVVSNWDERLRPLLSQLELAHYFEVFSISCEVGYSKPAAVIFEQAVRALRLPPETVLHLGDSLEMDLQGAQAAGLQALLLQRGTERRVVGSIRSLRELY